MPDKTKAAQEVTFAGKWKEIQDNFRNDLFKFVNNLLTFTNKPKEGEEASILNHLNEINTIMEKYKDKMAESNTNIFAENGLYHMIIRFSLKNKQIELNNMLVQLYNTTTLGSKKELEELNAQLHNATTMQQQLNADLEALKAMNIAENTKKDVELQKKIAEVTKLTNDSANEIEDLKKQLARANTVAAENKTNLEKSQKTSNDSITELLKTLQTISFTPTAPAPP
jgi:hypothetical protein